MSGSAVHLNPNLIGMMNGACPTYTPLCIYVNAAYCLSLVCSYTVASTDQDAVFASFVFLDTLTPFMMDLTWISPILVDQPASQSPEYDELVFRLGIRFTRIRIGHDV
jgi:hypothetical protein